MMHPTDSGVAGPAEFAHFKRPKGAQEPTLASDQRHPLLVLAGN